MNKILLLLLFLIVNSVSQDQSDFEQPSSQQSQQQTTFDQSNAQNEQQLASMRRTACLVLSRYHSNTQKDQIEKIVSSLNPQDQQKYINKIYAVAIEKCQAKITQSEVQQLFIENPNFSPQHLFHNFEDVSYVDVSDFNTFTPNQKSIVKYIKQFDENMEVKRQEKQAEKQELQGAQKMDLKLFGISFSEVSDTFKILYLLIFVLLVVGALYYGFSKLDKGNTKKSSKRRQKSPKKQK